MMPRKEVFTTQNDNCEFLQIKEKLIFRDLYNKYQYSFDREEVKELAIFLINEFGLPFTSTEKGSY